MGFIFAGCAVSHTPSIMVLPRGNASYVEFQTDEADCQQYAETRSSQASQRESQNSFGRTLFLGLLGAAAGASYGGSFGRSGFGAQIGATQGLTSGAAFGAAREEVVGQRAFDLTYVQCMRTKGHKLPGFQSIDDQPVQASSGDTSPRATSLPPVPPQLIASSPPLVSHLVPQQRESQLVVLASQQQHKAKLNVVQIQRRYNSVPFFLQPNTSSEKLGSVYFEVNLKVIEDREQWLYVESPFGRRGWILKEWTQE